MPPPDRWTDYKALGAVIPGTRLITFKVPLKKKLCETLPEKEQFTPQNLLSLVSGLGHQLGMVIDLTFTWKYYSAFEFQDQGVRHEKIFTEGHNVPNDDVVYRFFDTLESFFMEHPHEEQIVGVHCTHGINRTGYVVCRYLIERLGWDPEEAMRVYHKSRGYPIERENYIEDLQQRKLNEDYKYEGREKLPMKKPDQDRKGNKHQHNREWNHGQGSYHSHRQDMDSRQDEADNMYPSHSRLRPHRDFHHHRHDDQYRNGYPGDQYNHYRDGRNNYSDRQRYGKHRHNDYHRQNHSTNDWRHRSDGQFYSQNWGPWEHSWGHFRQGNRDDYSDDRNDYLYHHKRDRNLHRSGGSNRNQGCGQYQSRNDRSYHWHSENRSPGNRHDFDNENRSQRRSRHEVDERLRGELPVNKDKQIIEGQESEEGKR